MTDETKLKTILKFLAQTKEEITRRLAPTAELVTERDDETYAETVIAHVKEVRRARNEFDARLHGIANEIGTLGGKGWQKNDDIVQAWLAFAHVVQGLRHNPAKGPAVVYVSEDNKPIAFAAANFWMDEMEPSEKLQRKHLTFEGGRSALNICAEPAAIAKAVGHVKLKTRMTLRNKKSDPDTITSALVNKDFVPAHRVVERRALFLERVSNHGKKSGLFVNGILVTTADPCTSCTDAVVQVGIAEVISDVETCRHLMSPKRIGQMAESKAILQCHNIKHTHVAYRHNI